MSMPFRWHLEEEDTDQAERHLSLLKRIRMEM
jgi:hypothetical protein